MNAKDQERAAKEFSAFWKDKGYEKGQSQIFWTSLLRSVFGISKPETFIRFEDRVMLDHTSFIDGYIPSTHVLIEQKGINKDLRAKIKQSDGTFLTPFQQAKRYSAELPYSDRPRWIVISNFAELHVYDMEKPSGEPQVIKLADLSKEYHRLQFLVQTDADVVAQEQEISVKAGELVGKLYDELWKGYKDPTSEHALKSLNVLCVRLVFCLYAEDAGLFGRKAIFHDYLAINRDKPFAVRKAILELFEMMNTKEEDRDPYDDSPASEFPYVNGNLFADTDKLEIPAFTPEIVELLLTEASEGFDWSGISPTIFGAVFESTLNPETRRKGGMHYTSVENILKVINPLFMDGLNTEFAEIMQTKQVAARDRKLRAFQERLGSLKFLDPACGSGNFLTETYIQLRRLENKVILELNRGGGQFDFGGEHSPVKVQINQFYGIEINDFACAVAETALWIAESQMLKETEDIIGASLEFFPLKTNTNIHEGNALRMDWTSVLPKEELSFIMGNPPFSGARFMSKEQKADLMSVFGEGWKNAGNIDYVGCWFKKAYDLMVTKPSVHTAFVATNSINQGESVPNLWGPLIKGGVHINFAWRTFRWDSEASDKAHVHCVIIGFGFGDKAEAILFDEQGHKSIVKHINAYLFEGPDCCVSGRSKPICDVPVSSYGSFALDDGNFTISAEEYDEIISKESDTAKFLRPFVGARELMHDDKRWCVWLENVSLADYSKSKIIIEKIRRVRAWRSASNRTTTKLLADTPSLFAEIRQPTQNYLAVPTVCSERRKYLPIEMLTPDVIASNQIYVIPTEDIFFFGVLSSSAHNAWMRMVAGRLEMRYRYSNAIVYNNFPWPNATDAQKKQIRSTAKAILMARATESGCCLAKLYDPDLMPPALSIAHQKNDRAVLQAYGLPPDATEETIVAHLMDLYTKKVAEVERREAVDAAVLKVCGKGVESVPDWLEPLRQQAMAGKLSVEDLIVQGKSLKKELNKKKGARLSKDDSTTA